MTSQINTVSTDEKTDSIPKTDPLATPPKQPSKGPISTPKMAPINSRTTALYCCTAVLFVASVNGAALMTMYINVMKVVVIMPVQLLMEQSDSHHAMELLLKGLYAMKLVVLIGYLLFVHNLACCEMIPGFLRYARNAGRRSH